MSSYAGLDLVALIEQVSGISLTKKARHWQDGPEYWGMCPFPGCGGKDRFHVWPEAARPHYWCRVCNRNGSPPWFLVEYLGITYSQALVKLGLKAVSDIPQKNVARFQSDDGPGEMWLDQAGLHVHKAEMALNDPHGRGQVALDYLHGRGLTDATIQQCRLGYMPTLDGGWQYSPLEKWGLTVNDPDKPNLCLFAGIFIPWFLGDQIWKIEVRKLQAKSDDDYKIPSIRGSKNILYNCNLFRPGCIVVLCESALDAISGMQACGDLVVWMATGGTRQARQPIWVELLKQASCVLVAFDVDEPDEHGVRPGEEGAQFWLESLPNAVRAYPLAHDINAMLQAKMDIRAWLLKEIEHATLNRQPSRTLMTVATYATLARAHIAALRTGRLSPDRPADFGQWTNAVLDIEHIFMDVEQQCRGVETLPDGQVLPRWKPTIFENALARYAQTHPEVLAVYQPHEIGALPVQKLIDPAHVPIIERVQLWQELGMRFSVQNGQLHVEGDFQLSRQMVQYLTDHELVIIDWLRS